MKKHILLIITLPLFTLMSCQNKQTIEDNNNINKDDQSLINDDTPKKSYIDIIKEDLGATNVTLDYESQNLNGYLTTMELDNNKIHSTTMNGDTLLSESYTQYYEDKTISYGRTSYSSPFSSFENNQVRSGTYSLLDYYTESSTVYKDFFLNMEDLLVDEGNGIYKASDCLETSLESDSSYIKNILDQGWTYTVTSDVLTKKEGSYVEFEIRNEHLYRFSVAEYGIGGMFDGSKKEANLFISEDLVYNSYFNFRNFGDTVVTLPEVE